MISAITVEAVLLAAIGVAAAAVVGLVVVASSAVRSLRPTAAAAVPTGPEQGASLRSWEPPPVLAGEPPVPVTPIAPPPPPPVDVADLLEAARSDASAGVQFPTQPPPLVNPLALPVIDPADLAPKRLNRSTDPEGPDHAQ